MDTDGHGFQTAKNAKYTNPNSGSILAFRIQPSAFASTTLANLAKVLQNQDFRAEL
jgi:hypothetical protein